MYVIIIGCSRVGVIMARSLESRGHNVVVIERARENLAKLGRSFSGLTVVGNGFAPEVLGEAGIKRADALFAVTDNDNANIISVQVARKMFGVERAYARVYDQDRAETYRSMGGMGVEAVCSTTLVAEALMEKVFPPGGGAKG